MNLPELPEPFMLFDAQQGTIHWPIPTKIDLPMSVAIPPMQVFTEAQMLALRAATVEACAALVASIEARCIAKDVDDPPLEHVTAAIRGLK